jgi:hypothetical protein
MAYAAAGAGEDNGFSGIYLGHRVNLLQPAM